MLLPSSLHCNTFPDASYRVFSLSCILWICFLLSPEPANAADGEGATRRFAELRRYSVQEARQGPAVDGEYFYAVSNHTIAKYEKQSGLRVSVWEGPADGPIIHLNSGIVIEGRLYCAHSNYPGIPMQSSIEIFDTETLEHIGSHSFGIYQGSATWVDRKDGVWWVAFAHYEGRGGDGTRGPAWTSVVQFDKQWRRVGAYAFPPAVIQRFGTRSNSGGAWGPDGYLYITGHDAAEIYVLALPRAGATLELIEILPLAAEGQGIAWDRSEPGLLYSMIKKTREIVVSKMIRQ